MIEHRVFRVRFTDNDGDNEHAENTDEKRKKKIEQRFIDAKQ